MGSTALNALIDIVAASSAKIRQHQAEVSDQHLKIYADSLQLFRDFYEGIDTAEPTERKKITASVTKAFCTRKNVESLIDNIREYESTLHVHGNSISLKSHVHIDVYPEQSRFTIRGDNRRFEFDAVTCTVEAFIF